MEKLTEQQRTSIRKMSDERLRAKLVQVGYQEDAVNRLDRQGLIMTLAAYMADQGEVAQAAVVEEEVEGGDLDEPTEAQAGALSLEERRLFLEERRFQMEEQRWRVEMAFKEGWKNSV